MVHRENDFGSHPIARHDFHFFLSWPTTPVRAERGRSVNSVWAIQLNRV